MVVAKTLAREKHQSTYAGVILSRSLQLQIAPEADIIYVFGSFQKSGAQYRPQN